MQNHAGSDSKETQTRSKPLEGPTVSDRMPEVVIYLLEGRTLDERRRLVSEVTAALVNSIGVPVESVTVSLVETAKTAKAKGGVLFSDMAPR
jgi:4-oxalocrotonate tautomerase